MKLLDTAGKTLKKVAAAIVRDVPGPRRPRDPWYSDEARRAAVNSGGSGGRWLGPRRGGWLR